MGKIYKILNYEKILEELKGNIEKARNNMEEFIKEVKRMRDREIDYQKNVSAKMNIIQMYFFIWKVE